MNRQCKQTSRVYKRAQTRSSAQTQFRIEMEVSSEMEKSKTIKPTGNSNETSKFDMPKLDAIYAKRLTPDR